MLKSFFLPLMFLVAFCRISPAQAQPLAPDLSFEEHPMTHNFHIASDGKNYYTVNGGKASLGLIKKYNLTGELVETYSFNLDMRSIMYNSATKKFYVCCNNRSIYMITNMEKREVKEVLKKFYPNENAGLAMSPDGKLLYYLEDGTLSIYKFPGGKLVKTLKGFSCGNNFAQGGVTVAVDSKYIYTWNSEIQTVYVYDLDGNKIKEVVLSKGSFGSSLSCANGFIFVSDDGNYDKGNWYGYDIWKN